MANLKLQGTYEQLSRGELPIDAVAPGSLHKYTLCEPGLETSSSSTRSDATYSELSTFQRGAHLAFRAPGYVPYLPLHLPA
jgi:hypothetical protein